MRRLTLSPFLFMNYSSQPWLNVNLVMFGSSFSFSSWTFAALTMIIFLETRRPLLRLSNIHVHSNKFCPISSEVRCLPPPSSRCCLAPSDLSTFNSSIICLAFSSSYECCFDQLYIFSQQRDLSSFQLRIFTDRSKVSRGRTCGSRAVYGFV